MTTAFICLYLITGVIVWCHNFWDMTVAAWNYGEGLFVALFPVIVGSFWMVVILWPIVVVVDVLKRVGLID